MTKKDFELIAAALAGRRAFIQTEYANGRSVWDHAAYVLADALQSTNPRFDRARFLAACGVSTSV